MAVSDVTRLTLDQSGVEVCCVLVDCDVVSATKSIGIFSGVDTKQGTEPADCLTCCLPCAETYYYLPTLNTCKRTAQLAIGSPLPSMDSEMKNQPNFFLRNPPTPRSRQSR
ncbi:hypothetical protein T265_08546 [Opisthorchis viverrini]|uniref:Uncharacterized protein n=1 Tax=Opisthorchis viverrini TaxID=6198 RepID=A0A074ZJS4_OPIVI|nr:hypothetical protein T265_08546 [Opisthorchis viverrini]KER23605.1 hypothetical protein T265_08546 [Opisthorchis viverrini]